MAVVIQRMVNARTAGVMFTRSPMTGDRSVITIEGSWGLGSAVVSGEVTPDRFVIAKITGEISVRDISDKHIQHLPAPNGGVVEVETPENLRREPCLSDSEIVALRDIARRVERHYGRPQDIEWAVDQSGDDFVAAEPAGNGLVFEGPCARRQTCGESTPPRHENLRRPPMTLTAKDVAEIMRLLEQSSFDNLSLEIDGVKLNLQRGSSVPVRQSVAPASSAAPQPKPVQSAAPKRRPPSEPGLAEVVSPLLGIFYRAPKPGEPPFVESRFKGRRGHRHRHHRSDEIDELRARGNKG